MNKSDKKYIRDLTLLALVDIDCFDKVTAEMNDFDEAIADCLGMLDYSIQVNNKEEIKFWRQQLQQAKTGKRIASKLIEQNKTVKDLITA